MNTSSLVAPAGVLEGRKMGGRKFFSGPVESVETVQQIDYVADGQPVSFKGRDRVSRVVYKFPFALRHYVLLSVVAAVYVLVGSYGLGWLMLQAGWGNSWLVWGFEVGAWWVLVGLAVWAFVYVYTRFKPANTSPAVGGMVETNQEAFASWGVWPSYVAIVGLVPCLVALPFVVSAVLVPVVVWVASEVGLSD